MPLYFLFCLTSVLMGLGILSLARVKFDEDRELYLAPVLALVLIVIMLSVLLASDFTVEQVTPYIYTVCIGLGGYGLARNRMLLRAHWPVLLATSLLPLLILLPAIVEGFKNYSGGLLLDGWSYVVAGQTIQKFPLGSEGWLPLGAQYTASWGRHLRFVSCAFLALLAPLGGTADDVQQVLGPYLGLVFFAYTSACLFFAKAMRLRGKLLAATVLLGALSGWTLKIVNCNSIDNATSLCFLPALFGVFASMGKPSTKRGVLLGAMVAAELYAYPEAVPLTVMAAFLLTAERLFLHKGSMRDLVRMTCVAAATMALCISPFAMEIIGIFTTETRSMSNPTAIRPADNYYHSLGASQLALQGYWGLLPDFPGVGEAKDVVELANNYLPGYTAYMLVTAVVLSLIACIGLYASVKRRQWSIGVFVLVMSAIYSYLILHANYSYAAYKILNLSWFAVVYLFGIGLTFLGDTLSIPTGSSNTRTSAIWGAIPVLVVLGSFFVQERIFYKSLPFKSVREYRKISAVERLAHGEPVALLAQDTYANAWGIHFLRHSKVFVAGQYKGFMVNHAGLARSEPIDPTKIHILVTDTPNFSGWGELVDHVGPYWVWNCAHGPCAALVSIQNPNGLEGRAGNPAMWIGKGDTDLEILANGIGTGWITADLAIGPGLPAQSDLHVQILSTDGVEQDRSVSNGTENIGVPLHAGLNHVVIRATDCAKADFSNNPRPLLLKMSALSLSMPHPNELEIASIHNPNGIDYLGVTPYVWMGGGDTLVGIDSPADGYAEVTATLEPGPSLADRSRPRIDITPASGPTIQPTLKWGDVAFDVPVTRGLSWIHMKPLGEIGPNTTAPGDPRPMMIGFSHYRVEFIRNNSSDSKSSASMCAVRQTALATKP